MSPGWVSTDGSVGGVNCWVDGECALAEGNRALVEDVVVSFEPTAAPRTEVEGKSGLEIYVGDPLAVNGEAIPPPGDFGRSTPKIARNRSRFLDFILNDGYSVPLVKECLIIISGDLEPSGWTVQWITLEVPVQIRRCGVRVLKRGVGTLLSLCIECG